MAKLYTAKPIEFREFDLKHEGHKKRIANLLRILLCEFLRHRAHACPVQISRSSGIMSNRLEYVTAQQWKSNRMTSKLKVNSVQNLKVKYLKWLCLQIVADSSGTRSEIALVLISLALDDASDL